MSNLLDITRAYPEKFLGLSFHAPDFLGRLVFYAVQFAMNDFLAGYCQNIWVTLAENKYIVVENDGLCIPIEFNECDAGPKTQPGASTSPEGVTFLELFMSTCHLSYTIEQYQKYFEFGPDRDGALVINALSSDCRVTLWRDGYKWVQSYKDGLPEQGMKRVASTEKSGMCFSFKPYSSLRPLGRDFEGAEFLDVCDWLANPGEWFTRNRRLDKEITIVVIDEESGRSEEVCVLWGEVRSIIPDSQKVL